MEHVANDYSDSDIRYSYLGTLDHLPCELIRSLRLMQTIDLIKDERDERDLEKASRNLLSVANYIDDLVDDQIRFLKKHRKELEVQKLVTKTFNASVENIKSKLMLEEPRAHKESKLLLKINLKKAKSRERKESITSPEIGITREDGTESNNNGEEIYCFCRNVSYGSMVACDNSNCPFEWFHYGCVGLKQVPKGKWYCSEDCKEIARQSSKVKRQRKKK
ncbi:hypothetical protein SMKI_15G2170 [Saccharomyces mikatae IFO 1815]|uniref:Zinc finger PHD-type domain-containing protein n=1 Tax=Saccharomyces mikatae IFO 1815 TaxID=226126 RepID=A0AA35ND76_SACMI|nr:uncharacterized protein SMKI_15G2170 [Saccharomyces mikatae IFO 1815]CAI4036375.1 hypothetical protein SMKI_15G2170 [Saccharomyces mikatae IFO 1815]